MTKGKPRHPRPEDALVMLRDALAAAPKSQRRQQLLEGALCVYYAGMLNQNFKALRPRGRPKGWRGMRHDDSAAIAIMSDIAMRIGNASPHTLARRAVATGLVPLNGAEEGSVIKRLAGRYKLQTPK